MAQNPITKQEEMIPLQSGVGERHAVPGHVIEEDGTALPVRTQLNFRDGLQALDNSETDSTDVFIVLPEAADITYVVGDPADWDTGPLDTAAALDELAQRVRALE